MELRALKYFVEVVRQKSYTAAAQKLSVTQPTLSRQVADLEAELGQTLLTRTTRRVELTAKGSLFFRRAVSILALAEQAGRELQTDEELAGEIRIAAGEMPAFETVAAAVARLQQAHGRILCHFASVTADVAAQNLRLGLADIAVFSAGADLEGFESLALPRAVRWGVLTPRHGRFEGKTQLVPEDLRGAPLYLPQRFSGEEAGAFAGWARFAPDEIDCRGTYNLLYNAALLVHQGASALCIEGIAAQDDEVMFLPLAPALYYPGVVAWQAGRPQTAPVRRLIEEIRIEIGHRTGPDAASR